MKKGVVFGKFYPPHAGHKYLIDIARLQVDHLTVIVTGKKGQIMPARLRAKWIKEMFPDVSVKLIYYNIADDDDETWTRQTVKWLGYKPDLVFTSAEVWGDHFAQLLGARHISVDPGRARFNISGTKIRSDPQSFLRFLPPVVRKYFERKIRQQAARGKKYKIEEQIL